MTALLIALALAIVIKLTPGAIILTIFGALIAVCVGLMIGLPIYSVDVEEASEEEIQECTDKIITIVMVIVIVTLSLSLKYGDRVIVCDDQEVEKHELTEDLKTEIFNDTTYYEVTCDNNVFYIDDDSQLQTDGVYRHYSETSPAPDDGSKYEQITGEKNNE